MLVAQDGDGLVRVSRKSRYLIQLVFVVVIITLDVRELVPVLRRRLIEFSLALLSLEMKRWR